MIISRCRACDGSHPSFPWLFKRDTSVWDTANPSEVSVILHSPAHGVIVLGVTEAGGFQLAAHHGAGALISSQVALQSTLTIHARTWESTREAPKVKSTEFSCLFMFAMSHSPKDPKQSSLLNILWLYHSLYIVCALGNLPNLDVIKEVFRLLFLTVLLQALSVPGSLPPEGNDRLCFGLVVQGLHAARSIGTAEEQVEHSKNWSANYIP